MFLERPDQDSSTRRDGAREARSHRTWDNIFITAQTPARRSTAAGPVRLPDQDSCLMALVRGVGAELPTSNSAAVLGMTVNTAGEVRLKKNQGHPGDEDLVGERAFTVSVGDAPRCLGPVRASPGVGGHDRDLLATSTVYDRGDPVLSPSISELLSRRADVLAAPEGWTKMGTSTVPAASRL